MTAREVIENLKSFPEEATILAERIDGRFTAASRAVVVELSEDEQQRPIAEVAREGAPGLSYFLKIFVAREVVEDWGHLAGQAARLDPVEAVVYYAENDGYPAADE